MAGLSTAKKHRPMQSRANRRTHLEQQQSGIQTRRTRLLCVAHATGPRSLKVEPYLPNAFEGFTVEAADTTEAERWLVLAGYESVAG